MPNGLNERFGEQGPTRSFAQYPWPKDADEYTGAYLAGAIITDSGQDAGIGGCANLKLTQDFAKYSRRSTPTSSATGPGQVSRASTGAYEWGAGHAAELRLSLPELQQRGTDHTAVQRRRSVLAAKAWKGLLGRISVRQGVPSDKTDRSSLADLQHCGPAQVTLHANDRSFVLSTRAVQTRARLQILGTRTSSEAEWRYPPCQSNQLGDRCFP